MTTSAVLEAIAVTAELCGRTFTPAAAKVFADDLAAFPEAQILGALKRCRREVKGTLTVQDVVSRLDDGRPGPEEAWAMIPKDEATSAVWTDEMAEALRVAQPLLDQGDKVAARMAFKEAYTAAVGKARDDRRPVNWWPTLGHDARGRDSVLLAAVEQGRLPLERAQEYLSYDAPPERLERLLANAVKPLLGVSK